MVKKDCLLGYPIEQLGKIRLLEVSHLFCGNCLTISNVKLVHQRAPMLHDQMSNVFRGFRRGHPMAVDRGQAPWRLLPDNNNVSTQSYRSHATAKSHDCRGATKQYRNRFIQNKLGLRELLHMMFAAM